MSTTVTMLRRPFRIRFLATLVVGALITYRLLFYTPDQTWLPVGSNSSGALFRTNSTLGFGTIYVVSKENSPRRHNLLQAANITELDFTIPVQPKWTADDLDGHPNIGKGSLMAWLGHLHSLRLFLESGDETALILEDDVDWDIRLRSLQAPLVAGAMRTVLSSKSGSRHMTDMDDEDEGAEYPYGDPALWDLLYMGHCGDYFHPTSRGFEDGHVKPDDLASIAHISFPDKSLPNFKNLHPWTASMLANLGVPEHTRLVHRSVFPLCTFAYAVSRQAAHRLVEELANLDTTNHTAYDVAILISCRDQGLRCWSVNPEMFHHLPGKSIIQGIENITFVPPVDAMAREIVELRNETANIDCGFMNGGFSYPDGDMKRLEYLRKEVARKGRCLKKGRGLW
jgi:hypothetical protein